MVNVKINEKGSITQRAKFYMKLENQFILGMARLREK